MNCKKCGSPLEPNAVVCKNCGTSVDVLIPGTPGVTPVTSVEPAPVVQQPAPQPAVQQPVQPQPVVPTAPVTPTPVAPVAAGPQAIPMPNIPPQKKGNKMVIAIVAVVAIIAVVAVLYFTVFNKKDEKKPSGGSSTSNETSNPTSNVPASNPNPNPTPTANTYDITHGGFTFHVPLSYSTQVGDNILYITDNQKFQAGITVVMQNFSNLSVDVVKQNCVNAGYNVSNAESKTINGHNYIVLSVNINGQNAVLAYTKLGSYYVAGVVVVTPSNTFDTTALNDIDPILSGATQETGGFGMEASKIPSSDVVKFIEG